ncbi:MAG: type II secretion system protein [Deltaproteobacteria bacterium]|jgi:type II secretory pathway pseudopilin PulG|nr:type II secretion system protein [Deltaproteobacteria bacterium]
MLARAFTLLEILLVMGMLSVISLIFISYSGDVGNVSVDALSRKIQSDIRFAQQLATSTGVSHGVQFTASGNYIVYENTPSTPATDPFDRGPMVEDLEEYGDITIGSNYTVEFNKVGKPTTGGGGNVEVVADSGAARTIYVIENTGAVIVDILDYGSGCGCHICLEE